MRVLATVAEELLELDSSGAVEAILLLDAVVEVKFKSLLNKLVDDVEASAVVEFCIFVISSLKAS